MASQTVNGECVDDEAWQCPLSWMGVLPVLTPALCQGQSADFDSCYESRCLGFNFQELPGLEETVCGVSKFNFRKTKNLPSYSLNPRKALLLKVE